MHQAHTERDYKAKLHVRDVFRGWEAQGFLTPEVDFSSIEFLKCTQGFVLEHVQFPPPKEPATDNLAHITPCM